VETLPVEYPPPNQCPGRKEKKVRVVLQQRHRLQYVVHPVSVLEKRIQCFLDPWIRDEKKSGSGPGNPDTGIRIRGEHPRSFFGELRNSFWLKTLKFFDADPGPGIFLTLDPGSRMKNSDPG
jgi:hypothetical protein